MRRSFVARTRRLLACVAAATCTAGIVAAPSQAASYPVIYNGLIGYRAHALTPDTPAAGSIYVDWRSPRPAAACHSQAHPDPIVLVGGTWANQADDFAAVSPLLADNGYCVYTDNLGAAPGAPVVPVIGG